MTEIFGKRMRKYLDFAGKPIVPLGTPIPLHGVNPRSMLDPVNWDKIRKDTYKKYNYKCAVCNETGLEQGFNHPVEAHEIWDYDFDTYTQYFEGMVALCPICHKIIHWDQNRMAYQNGNLSYEEYQRQERLKEEKLEELHGREILYGPIQKKSHMWHEAEWVSDFSKLKELYPEFYLKSYFDTKYNGYFKRETNSYIYKKTDNINDVLF